MSTHKYLSSRHLLTALLLLWGLTLGALPARAHKASDAYAVLADGDTGAPQGTLRVQLSLALKDLDAALPSLDADNNRQLTWGEIRLALPEVSRWVGAGMSLACGAQVLVVPWAFDALEQRSDGVYVRLVWQGACDPAQRLTLDYRLMKDLDPTHRLLLTGETLGQPVLGVLAPQGRSALALRAGPAGGTDAPSDTALQNLPRTGPGILWHFLPEGVHHIATGYDHLAFLLVLLLPIVLVTRHAPAPLGAAQAQRPGLGRLLTTVTGFTLGHSITLVLATLGWITAPGWVEAAIAITIAISALLNLYPVKWVRGDLLALGFGLIHGLGFSSIMREAGVSGPLLPWALAGFNLGVEAGQLVGVALWCALHLVLVRWRGYERVVVRGGSWALLALALYWAVERW
jgi:hypothetical protein